MARAATPFRAQDRVGNDLPLSKFLPDTLQCRSRVFMVPIMTTRLALAILSLAALAAVFGQAAQAAQLGPYVGGSFGITERDFQKQQFDDFLLNGFFPTTAFVPSSHVSSLDTKDQGYAALIGYRITAHWAIEGMYMDLGDITYRATTEGMLLEEPLTVNSKFVGQVGGIGLYALGIWPISYRWEVYGRGGFQFTTPRLDGRINNGAIEFNRESTTDIVAGIGVAMTLMDIYGARLEYMRVLDAGESATGEADTDYLSLGIIVAF